ncbi:hypothetical protein ACLB2K_058688 [Fragaria x ananassa]
MRLRISAEVAGALSYLHSAAGFPIYHRDIKTTNILLDDKYRAKVADFGTSRSVSIDQTHLTTFVHGTFGYLDPEYFQSSQFTDKSDVYSFGVVLVELLTGEKPVSLTRSQEARGLVSYFNLSVEENNSFDIIDARVKVDGVTEDILVVANLAKRCLDMNGKRRPTMKEVAMELEVIHKSVISSNTQQNHEEVEYVRNEVTCPWDVATTVTGASSKPYNCNGLLFYLQELLELAWDTQFMLGLAAATSVRVSNELGAGHPKVAKFSVFVVNGTRILISILFTAIVLIFKVGLSELFTSDTEGIWWGMIIGVFLQTPTLIVLTARTNWDTDVVNAAERLKRSASVEDLLLEEDDV